MFGRMAMAAFAVGLTACAGLESAGRNANRSPQPTQTASAPSPTPAPPAAATTAPTQTPAPVAQQVTAPPSTTPAPTAPRPASADDDIVVPGQGRVQVPGDPRSNEQRMADIRAWDQCVIQVQSAFDADPMRPQLTTPEEYCRESLGMVERTAVPLSRQ
ncbi:MAG: hypothetical protein ACT4OF_14615 [Caulobacteraceae bacterium]